MAESVFAIALLLGATELNGEGGENAVTLLSDDGSVAVTFRPWRFFVVAKGHDSTFGPDWGAKFVAFNGLNTHRGENGNMGVF
jgi:hypothetical protein